MRLWNKFSREALDTPSLEVFKARQNGDLNNQGSLKVSLPMAVCWKLDYL